MQRKLSVLLILALVLSPLAGAFVAKYMLEKQMTVTVVLDYKIELYLDENCTKPASTVAFGVVALGVKTSSAQYYLKNLGKSVAAIIWNCTGLPSGISLAGYALRLGNSAWESWPSNSGFQVASPPIAVKWEITASVEGSFSWTLTLASL